VEAVGVIRVVVVAHALMGFPGLVAPTKRFSAFEAIHTSQQPKRSTTAEWLVMADQTKAW
jgi:hypothetical protein